MSHIYGGITYTDLPITNIGYPSTGYHSDGKGVLLGAYILGCECDGVHCNGPEERVQKAVEYGSQIHPQYREEFHNGVAVAWHRAPFTMGCFGMWTDGYARPTLRQSVRIDGVLCLPVSTPPASAVGRKARSPRRSMPSSGCISALSPKTPKP